MNKEEVCFKLIEFYYTKKQHLITMVCIWKIYLKNIMKC